MIISSVQKNFLLITAVSLLILVVFFFTITWFLVGKIKEISKEYLDGQKELLHLSQRESLIRDLKNNYQEHQEDLLEIDGAFLDSEEIAGFITDLEKTADQTNNDFEIQVTNEPSIDEVSFMGFHITLTGSFFNFIRFLASLEDTPYPPYRLIEINDLVIKQIREKGFKEGIPIRSEGVESVLNIKIYTQ